MGNNSNNLFFGKFNMILRFLLAKCNFIAYLLMKYHYTSVPQLAVRVIILDCYKYQMITSYIC